MTMKPTKDNRKKFDLDLAYGQVREDAIKDMLQDKKIEGKRCVIINRRGKVRSLDEKMGDLTDLLIKYQENKSEPFYLRSLIKNFQIEQLQEDLLL